MDNIASTRRRKPKVTQSALDGTAFGSATGLTNEQTQSKAEWINAMRYTLHEWVQKETQSYGEHIEQMNGAELIEEYRRQGGDAAAYFDPVSEEIVVDEEIEPNDRTSG